MSGVGIRKVAELAKVSIGTVSKILNPKSEANIRVSPETRAKVLAAAAQLKYEPSYGARLLRGENARTIGFAIALPGEHCDTYLSDYTFRILNGVGREAAKNHFQVLLIQGEDYRYYMDCRRIDALVITGFTLRNNPHEAEMREMLQRFEERAYPYAVINHQPVGFPISGINVDNESGMRQIAELIRRKKFESVGFAGELTPNPLFHHSERVALLRNFLPGSGCQFSERHIFNGSGNGLPELPRIGRYSHEDGRTAFRILWEKKDLPRCIVCGNDDIAFGLHKAALEAGVRIPEQLAIIGFDDAHNVDHLTPALTTVRQELEEYGRAAVRYLIAKMEDTTQQLSLRMEPKLIERQTT